MKRNVKRVKETPTPDIFRRTASTFIIILAAFSVFASFLAYTGLSLSVKQLVIPRPVSIERIQLSENVTWQERKFVLWEKNYSRPENPTTKKKSFRIAKGLTNVGYGRFYIFTIQASRPDPESKWNKLYITGWEPQTAGTQNYTCCLRYDNGTSGLAFSKYKLSWSKANLNARQVVCTSTNYAIEARPTWASLVLDSESCDDKAEFHKVVYRQPDKAASFAICGKIAYGKKDPRYIIEWMEYHKYMGVDKIVIYVYEDLQEPARKVLKYYVDEGILETVEMPSVPMLDKYPRHFSVQATIMWQDEKVPLFDVEQRLKSYTYYGVIDTDEFIIPKQPGVKTFVGLMEHLTKKYKRGSSFMMKSQIHIMSWNKTNPDSDLLIEQYVNRTETMIETPKLLHITSRVSEGSVWIHGVHGKPGFSVVTPTEEDVVLKHFRYCKKRWILKQKNEQHNKCYEGFQRHRDTHMADVAKVIGPRIRHVASMLGF